MKLNKKGFTLIELLAVVVILLVISVIAISSISAAIERSKNKQDQAKIDLIISYGSLYFDSHKNTLGVGDIINITKLNLSQEENTYSSGEIIRGCIKMVDYGKYVFLKNGEGGCIG